VTWPCRPKRAFRLGQIYYAIGDYGRAMALFQRNVEALKADAGHPVPPYRIQSQGYLAVALSALGQLVEGRRHGEEALVLSQALGMRPLQAHCHGGLGTLYAKIGRQEHAHSELSTAIEMYHTTEMTFWLPQSKTALAQIGG
jgi:tetratricopeptide (TPR) repeat protein